jgi:hypothetical protein
MQLQDWIDLGFKIAGLVGGLLGSIGGVAVWMARRTLVTHDDLRASFDAHDDRHKELDKRLADGERQFAVIRSDIEHLPDVDDLADLKDRVGDVEGSIRALTATVGGLKDVLERVERPLNILVEHHLKA